MFSYKHLHLRYFCLKNYNFRLYTVDLIKSFLFNAYENNSTVSLCLGRCIIFTYLTKIDILICNKGFCKSTRESFIFNNLKNTKLKKNRTDVVRSFKSERSNVLKDISFIYKRNVHSHRRRNVHLPNVNVVIPYNQSSMSCNNMMRNMPLNDLSLYGFFSHVMVFIIHPIMDMDI